MLALAMTQPRPDLAREGRDRGLAAGAGDGGDGRGLARKELRRGERQRMAHIGDLDEGDMIGQRVRRCALRHHGAGAGRERLGQEGEPVGLGAWHRREQEVGLHRAAVGRNPMDIEGAEPRFEAGIAGQEFAQLHRAWPKCLPARESTGQVIQ